MNTVHWIGTFLVGATLAGQAQSDLASRGSKPTGASDYSITERGPHHRVWSKVTLETNHVGRVVAKTNSYTELATGMHFKGTSGEWVEAKEQFQLKRGRAVASAGAHQVSLPANLNTAGGIELEMPDGKLLRSHVLGLSYFDAASGKSVLIAEVKDCEGELQSSNVVVYADAFTDFGASVRYTYTRAGLEQDIIVVERPPSPEKFGLNPATTRLQVLTEFVDPPQPTKVRAALNVGSMDELVDEELDFGLMQMGRGKAFSTGTERQEVPVGKQWLKLDGRDCLVEEVVVTQVTERLKALPAPKRTALNDGPSGAWRKVSSERLLPPRPQLAKASPEREIRLAQAAPRTDGLVLDYVLVSSKNGYVFRGDETYHVSGAVTLSGNVTFEGGAVIKYSPGASITLASGTILNWKGAPYLPVVFTACDDHSIGQAVSTGTLSGYYANPALSINGGPVTPVLKHFRVAHAAVGFGIGGASPSFYHGQIVNCANGLTVTGGSAYVRNVLFANLQFAFNNLLYAGVNAQHATFSGVTTLAAGSGQYAGVTVVNSILANVPTLGTPPATGNNNGFFNAPAFGSAQYSATVSPFAAPVGAGAYYLTETTPFRNVGASSIDSTLLGELPKKTTSAPLVRVDQTETASITLTPAIARDADALDLGYHYDPIDYLASVWAFENCTLTINNGTVIGYYDTTGLWLKNGTEIICEGTPLAPNRFVDYRTVQEQPVKLGLSAWSPSTGFALNPHRASNVGSPGTFRFTEFSRMARGSYSGYDLYASDTNFKYSALAVRDCVFRGGRVEAGIWNGSGTSVEVINNLFEREIFSASGTPKLRAYNNLFKNCAWAIFEFYTGAYAIVRDNAFDGTTVEEMSETGALIHSHNAYINCTGRLNPAQTSDKVLTSFSYATGSLGDYYHASTDLVNAGSRSAADAGLFHHTVKTTNVKEFDDTPDTVDIGYHYVAVNGSGQPLDTNGNGVPDYRDLDSDSDGLPDAWEWKHFGSLSRNGSGNYDNDGPDDAPSTDFLEWRGDTEPNNIRFSVKVPTRYVRSGNVAVQLKINAGEAFKMAVLVDSTDFAGATWNDCSPIAGSLSLALNLGAAQGLHRVQVGLRGHSAFSEQTWEKVDFVLDNTPPTLTLTAPTESTTGRPVIQVHGYSSEPLQKVSYTISTAEGTFGAFVTDQTYDATTKEFTRNDFQCYDVRLAPSDNTIDVTAWDLAGNQTTVSKAIALNLAADSTAPTITHVFWPPNGATVSGDVWVRGKVDDETARVTIAVGGQTFTTTPERDGDFRVKVPASSLASGGNTLTITARDAKGNLSEPPYSKTLTITKSDSSLTVNEPGVSKLMQRVTGEELEGLTLTGVLPTPAWSVVVNGVAATVKPDCSWTASNVPLLGRTAASFDVVATPPSGPTVKASVLQTMPPYFIVAEHDSMSGSCTTRKTEDMIAVTEVNRSKRYSAYAEPKPNGVWERKYFGRVEDSNSLEQSPDRGMSGTTTYVCDWSESNPGGSCEWGHVTGSGSTYETWTPMFTYLPAAYVPEVICAPDRAVVHTVYDVWGKELDSHVWHYHARGVSHRISATDQTGETVASTDSTVSVDFARTRSLLYTGGTPGSKKNHLFCIFTEVKNILAPSIPSCWEGAGLELENPGNVRVLGHSPGSDGKLWVELPDNAEADLTVSAPGMHFQVEQAVTKLSDIDLDVDSDNTGAVDGTEAEDLIELQLPGKYVPLNCGDADDDGVPDFADGYDLFGTANQGGQSAGLTPANLQHPFVVYLLTLQLDPSDMQGAKVRFSYSASDPNAVQHSGNTYTAPETGGLRLWAKDGSAFRKKSPINTYVLDPYGNRIHNGDYVAPGIEYSAADLPNLNLYIEGVRPGTYTITVEMDPDGNSGFIAKDQVAVTVVDLDLDIDSDNDDGQYAGPSRNPAEDAIESNEAKPGKVIVVNNEDADGDDIPDFADFASANDQLVPLVLQLPSGIPLANARMELTYSPSTPADVSQSGTPPLWQPGPSGHIRLWRKQASMTRNPASALDDATGDYIAPGMYTDLTRLGFSDASRTITLYVEGIHPTSALADRQVKVVLYPDQGGTTACGSDTVLVSVVNCQLVPDFNHDRMIDETDRQLLAIYNPFRFWLNNDADSGDVASDGSDIPGASTPNWANDQVDGRCDLVDFFPVWLDIEQVLKLYPAGSLVVTLAQADSAAKVVYTDLDKDHAGDYHTVDSTTYGANRNQNSYEATTLTVETLYQGTTVQYFTLDTGFVDRICSGSGKGILLVEARGVTEQPLTLQVRDPNHALAVLFECKLNLRFSSVEDMFRHRNLVAAASGTVTVPDRNTAPNYPDELTNGKNFVFVHGYNVNQQAARGTFAEVFKRMYWAGSKARFYGVSWYGYDSQDIAYGLFTPNYHINVDHAFTTAPVFKSFLDSLSGERVVAAHSLGNMVVLSALNDHNAPISKYFMLDAAVAMEAIDDGAIAMNMTHSTWRSPEDYDSRLYANSWWARFPSGDARSTLAWRNRFATLGSAGVYNFYSSGEEVLRDYDNDCPLFSSVLDLINYFGMSPPLGSYAWVWQEKSKGIAPLDTIGGSTHNGWKFNSAWDPTPGQHMPAAQANVLTDLALQAAPFFDSSYYNQLFNPTTGSQFAAENRNRILSDGIPATSWAVGSHSVSWLGIRNHNMNSEYQSGWPASRSTGAEGGKWHHSDFKDVGYPFVHLLFDEFADLGSLK